MRSRMVVVTSSDLAMGFRLSGVETVEAADVAEAEAAVEQMILGSNVGVVAVSDDFHQKFSPRLTRLMAEAEIPLVIPFPGKEANAWQVTDRLDYVASLIRSAIGYHIKLTR